MYVILQHNDDKFGMASALLYESYSDALDRMQYFARKCIDSEFSVAEVKLPDKVYRAHQVVEIRHREI